MNSLVLFAILALISPIFCEDEADTKKLDKRGILGLGYGGYYNPLAAGYGHAAAIHSPAFYGAGHAGLLPAAPASAAAAYKLATHHGNYLPGLALHHGIHAAGYNSHYYNLPYRTTLGLGYHGGYGIPPLAGYNHGLYHGY